MPNLVPPVTTVAAAEAYRDRILAARPAGSDFRPLMTCYLTDQTSADEIEKGHAEEVWIAAKLYPAGATTNSHHGVRDLKALSSPFEEPIDAVDLHRVLDRAVATVTHEIDHRARLIRDDGEVALVSGSEGRLIQVFVNLLVNAAQAIPDGDVDGNEIRLVTRMSSRSIGC